MAYSTSAEHAQEAARERLEEGHSIFVWQRLIYHNAMVADIGDDIEAIENEGWTFDSATVSEITWIGVFRSLC